HLPRPAGCYAAPLYLRVERPWRDAEPFRRLRDCHFWHRHSVSLIRYGGIVRSAVVTPIVADAAVAVRGDLGPFKKDLKGVETQTQTLGQKIKGALSPKNLALGAGAAFGGAQV